MRSLLLVVAAGLCAAGGCNKPKPEEKADKGSPVVKAVPEQPAKAAPQVGTPIEPPAPKPKTAPVPPTPALAHPLAGQVSTVDLTPYGIRAVIDLPAGATFHPNHSGSFRAEYANAAPGKPFVLKAEPVAANFSLAGVRAAARNTLDKPDTRADADDRYFLQGGTGQYAMARTVATGDQRYLVTFECAEPGELAREKVQPLWAALESIRQTEAQQKAEAARASALKKIRRDANSYWYRLLTNELVVTLPDDAFRKETLDALRDIPDLHTLRIAGAPNFDAALYKEFVSLPQLRGVWLEGGWATDEALAPVAANPKITDVTLIHVGATEKGLGLLEKLPQLRSVKLEFCTKLKPEAVEAFQVKSPKVQVRVLW